MYLTLKAERTLHLHDGARPHTPLLPESASYAMSTIGNGTCSFSCILLTHWLLLEHNQNQTDHEAQYLRSKPSGSSTILHQEKATVDPPRISPKTAQEAPSPPISRDPFGPHSAITLDHSMHGHVAILCPLNQVLKGSERSPITPVSYTGVSALVRLQSSAGPVWSLRLARTL